MGMPTDIGVIDLMMGTHAGPVARSQYDFLRARVKDQESRDMSFPVGYMFKDVPFDEAGEGDQPPQGADLLLPLMDHYGIEQALIGVDPRNEASQEAVRKHPDRFLGSYQVEPNEGMEGVRKLVDMHETWGIKAATAFPCGYNPQVPINDKRFYPFYAKCVELDIPVFVCAGVPGPRVPMEPQYVGHLDEVCYDFPELRLVTRHGCEPWTDLAVKLMLKWPNLSYSTSAFAPKHYPEDIVYYANTRGADQVMYAGYFPMALSLDRIFSELPDVPFRDHVWPKFLRENAARVLKLDE